MHKGIVKQRQGRPNEKSLKHYLKSNSEAQVTEAFM